MRFGLMAFAAFVLAATVQAFPDIPRASADALGVTKGKPFEEGVVFINGKYLPPPYTVERWGTGIRINRRKVSGQIVEWSEFLKTQSGVKVTRQAVPEQPAAPVELAPEPGSEGSVEDSSLDDLFDDDAAGKSKSKAKKRTVRKAVRKTNPTSTYALEGDFVLNDAAKSLVARINAIRSEIDRTLRMGGFVFFGDNYSRISGDSRTADRLMASLPEIMQKSDSERQFATAAREANLVFLTDRLCGDLFRNRIDYRTLQERWQQMQKDREWKKTLDNLAKPSF